MLSDKELPAEGLAGLKRHFKQDALSGFLVFLLALPLSLGIAKASGFPAAMGVLTAMIGGLIGCFFKVSALTIKGPAAGLITVCAASVLAFGGGKMGWEATAGIIVVMSVLQLIIARMGWGSMSDFFPFAAVHGMLAAIGFIIMAKQIPVLLGVAPELHEGKGPIPLIVDIPEFISLADPQQALVGLLALILMFAMPALPLRWTKRVPAPMWVLMVTVPLGLVSGFDENRIGYDLVQIGNFWSEIQWRANFSAIGSLIFWKFVMMFLFVNSLESLLTVKAMDDLDPWKRSTEAKDDLTALSAGNFVSGWLGGLPMISEVVRSGANVKYGARTKWANVFHGFFLLIAMAFSIPFIELIPNTSLAAMLIYAGYQLASPTEFRSIYRIGKEQLLIFLVTILVTLLEDLLLGVAAGMFFKLLIHLYHGARVRTLFKAHYQLDQTEETTYLQVHEAAVFTLIPAYRKLFRKCRPGDIWVMDFSNARLVDHSFLAFVFRISEREGDGQLVIRGLDKLQSLSDHPEATRKQAK